MNHLSQRQRSHIEQLINQHLPQVRKLRRHIHQYPDLSGSEQPTASHVAAFLHSHGICSNKVLDQTGLRVDLGPAGENKAPMVLRADTDALPLQEQNDIAFKSTQPGKMHACGHDMHTAALAGALVVLKALDQMHFPRPMVGLFQPSEEVEPGGASQLIAQKVFPENAHAVFGLHVSPEHPTGTIAFKPGADYAGVVPFDITITGRGGHCGTPQNCNDPIVCGAALVSALQTLVSRNCAPHEAAVVSVGIFSAGVARNIIPDTAHIKATMRYLDPPVAQRLKKRIEQCCTHTAAAFNCQSEVCFLQSYPPGFNNEQLTETLAGDIALFPSVKHVAFRDHPIMYAEDFAYYQKKCPGVFAYLGVRPAGSAQMSDLHSPTFLPDEDALYFGMLAHIAAALLP